MKTFAAIVGICCFTFHLWAALPPDYESRKADAEKLYAESSFAKASELYASVNLTNLPPMEQRWVQFRRADTQWRSQAGTRSADTTRLDDARRSLEVLIRDVTRDEDRDRIWAEIQESLGDFFWERLSQQNWGEAWPHYQAALDWWAGAPDLKLARDRYLAIVWKISRPPGVRQDYYYGYWGNQVPPEILENALKIAQTENDKSHAHFLIAMLIRNQGGLLDQRARVPEEFEAALKPGKAVEWYDDALYNYAEWMANQGRVVPLENGGWQAEPDYVKALELFRRLVSEFKKGETRYWDQAQQQIKNITDPQLGISVPNIFLPDSEIQYFLNWRNVKRVELSLYQVQLNRDVKLDSRRENWLESIDISSLEKIKSWTYDPHPQPLSRRTGEGGRRPGEGNSEDYRPGSDALRFDEKLKPGAYVLVASGNGRRARDLILVSDASLVLKSSGKQALVYFCNALDGSPLANSRIKLWEQWPDGNTWHTREQNKETGADGIAVFELQPNRNGTSEQLFVSAIRQDRQAFSAGNSYQNSYFSAGDDDEIDAATGLPDKSGKKRVWRIYAFTDRPAYRPKETVNWKFIGRQYDGSVYSTPAHQTLKFEIFDARGTKVKEGESELNSFGSTAGSLELTEQMPLGEYSVQFWDKRHQHQIGDATLFRLEEYKLPEFKVTVQTPEEESANQPPHRKTFRLGEKVEATIQADYYFGGPVANASVEVLVHQSPYWHGWQPPHPFPWYYEDMGNEASPYGGWRRGFGGDQIIRRETLKTDVSGKATLTFESPANAGQDFEYRIEARVTDSSRREITGSGTVRVTRQRYYVYANPVHNLFRPQDKVEVNFKAMDANDQPVQTEGSVKVTRDYWFETWQAPDGHEVKGDELKRLQSAAKIWPPPPERPDQKGWRLKFRGYEHDDILTRSVKTDTNGEAQFTFTPEREGYYRVAWTSADQISKLKSQIADSIRAETTVWVATGRTTELGYRHGGVEIIVDKDTFRVGQRAPVMLLANSPDRYVLFSVEGDDLYSYQLVHLDGTVKLIELPVEEKHVPNMFLNAALVSDRQLFTDSKQIIVPPTKNFLTVDVKSDRIQYQPRDEGTFTVTTKDDNGKPVSAEIALSLVDESVFYIQNDYAGDPRQFFFGSKRNQQVQTQSTFQQKAYAKLIEGDDKQLLDEKEQEARLRQKDESGYAVGDDYRLYDKTEAMSMAKSVTALGAVRRGGGWGGGGGGGAIGGILDQASANVNSPAAAPPPTTGMPISLARKIAAQEVPGMSSANADGEEPAVIVRSDFRSTIFWQPDVITDTEGKATVKIKYPDSTTSWKATARAITMGNQFGIADATTRTRQPLIVRLEAPRFFVVGDTVTISAVINNNTDEARETRANLDALGGLQISGVVNSAAYQRTVTVPANGEARVDWIAEVKTPGEVKLKATAHAGKYSDAMEKTYTAYEHGIEKFISRSGKIRGDDVTIKLDLPRERKSGSTSLSVQVTPSLAVTMLDALPYLIDYPYGCTEQTMSRFLPAAITAKTLRDLGLEPADVMARSFGGIETNSAAATHPKGKRDLSGLNAITRTSLDRLYDFQHGDGGWGWWKEGESDHWMTAYVIWGLSLAREADVKIKDDVLNRGISFLDKELVEEEMNPDMQAFMLHALSASQKRTRGTPFQETAFANLWKNREKLNAYTRSLLALSAHNLGKTDEAKTLIANLENGVKRDEHPDTSVLIQPDTSHAAPDNSVQGTAHWGEDGIYWHWSEGGVEATTFALRALLAIDPQNKLIEPVTNWLIKNRRGAQWNNTRDTAMVVLAMNDYLRTSGELKNDAEFELIVNGTSIARKKISGRDAFDAPSRFTIDPKLIRDNNDIRIRCVQSSMESRPTALYFAADARFFSTEEPIASAGNEIFVKRNYYKLVGRPTLLKGYVYDRQPLRDGEHVRSGERVETVVTIEAKNNYEYLMFEDLKPAGLEAVEVRSGESLYARELKSGAVEQKFASPKSKVQSQSSEQSEIGNLQSETDYTGRSRWVYQELRDRKVALFIDKLPEGVWEIRYDLRAEAPGQFHALPVTGQAMYVPEIRCNGAEARISVDEEKAD